MKARVAILGCNKTSARRVSDALGGLGSAKRLVRKNGHAAPLEDFSRVVQRLT